MFWTAMGLIIAILAGFIILRIYGDPDGTDINTEEEYIAERDMRREEKYYETPRKRKRQTCLTVLRYATYILMFAGLIVFIVYGCLVA